ncbi:MAG: oxygen-independent coproporphyrinogen III oxidase [Myxococcales bacterium]|nr:oxygen-independent coproporphyrinogen III oxidase [Myxococcales bacterium]
MMLQRTDETTACLAEHAARGPRYTSYPPATQFGPIAADRVRQELARIGRASEPVSLYVHVPFCKSLCAYCGCNVIPTRDENRGVAYVDQLATEMTLLSGQLFTAKIVEIALGGGSPNFLEPKTLRTLMAAIDRYFSVSPDARKSIELDPRRTTTAQIEALGELRFNSISLGVQDFAAEVQDAIRRHQSVTQTKWLVERCRAAGMKDINVDIVYGLPRQTEGSFTDTLDAVIDLAPERIALFGYAHLPDKLPHQRLVERAGRVLDGFERASLLLLGIEKLTGAGYIHLGLDHFAKPGSPLAKAAEEHRMGRTFQGYVEHRADNIIGLGTSAISSTPRMFWQNHSILTEWEAAIDARQLPVRRGFVLDRDDRVRRALIEELMCEGEIDLAALGRRYDVDAEKYFETELRDLESLGGLAAHDAATHRITTTPMGKLLVRNVCMVFDRYFRESVERPQFSSTI